MWEQLASSSSVIRQPFFFFFFFCNRDSCIKFVSISIESPAFISIDKVRCCNMWYNFVHVLGGAWTIPCKSRCLEHQRLAIIYLPASKQERGSFDLSLDGESEEAIWNHWNGRSTVPIASSPAAARNPLSEEAEAEAETEEQEEKRQKKKQQLQQKRNKKKKQQRQQKRKTIAQALEQKPLKEKDLTTSSDNCERDDDDLHDLQ